MKNKNHLSTSVQLGMVVVVGLAVIIGIGIRVASAFIYYGGYGVSCNDEKNRDFVAQKIPRFIAHAGGGINGLAYTNSLEALENSYSNGIRFFELDVNKTSDKRIVLRHGWNEEGSSINYPTGEVPTYKEYMGWDLNHGLTTMDFATAFQLLDENPDAFFIIDIKVAGQMTILQLIVEQYPEYVSYLIPQISFLSEKDAERKYSSIRKLGFEKIIMTYRHLPQKTETERSLIRFVRDHDVFAVSMPFERAITSLPRALYRFGVPTLSHTINNSNRLDDLESNYCVKGVYTDYLY